VDRLRSVGETHFFRHPAQFEHMVRVVEARRRWPIRIWSAGCANGAEIYSAALLLSPRTSGRERYHLSGSDFNAEKVVAARAGRYTAWHMRGCSDHLRQRYFHQVDESHWQLDPEVLAKVDIFCHDLVDGPDVEPQDIIFCRNVLIYMDPPTMLRVVDRLQRWLAPDGVLYLGYSEAVLAGQNAGLELIDSSLAAYRRRTFQLATLPIPVLLPPIPLEPLRINSVRPAVLAGRPEALRLLEEANQFVNNNQPRLAARSLKKSLYLDPSLAVSHYQLGLLELGEQRVEQARRHWRNVVALASQQSPQDPVPGWDSCNWEQLLEWTRQQLVRLGDGDV